MEGRPVCYFPDKVYDNGKERGYKTENLNEIKMTLETRKKMKNK